MLKKITKLFLRYPDEPCVRPESFTKISNENKLDNDLPTLTFQTVSDKYYFLLFGAIREKLGQVICCHVDLILVRSINGAVGSGWLAELKRSSLVAWLWNAPWVRAYGGLISGVAYRCATWMHPLSDFKDWARSKSIWHGLQKQGDDYSLNINGVEVADLLIDSYLRFRPSPKFNVYDPFVRRLIWQALRDIRQAQAYFENVRPRWYLTSYSTYLEHGIPVRVALQYGVNVWSFASLRQLGKKLSQNDIYHTDDFSKYKLEFDMLEQQDVCLEAARVQLESRLSGVIDAATSYMRKSPYAQSDVKVPLNLKNAVVIFLHDFYDSPHVYPDLIFRDFWHWVSFTIDVLQKSNINFFLKPHPNQIALSDQALDELKKTFPGLQWLPSEVSNVNLAHAGIACGVTMYGTVSHELAYIGIPSICCARHPHYTFGFCRTAKSREEYEDMLRTYALMPINREEMQRQALAFYYMHNLYGKSDELKLRAALTSFWRACNVGMPNEGSIMRAFHKLRDNEKFSEFVSFLIRTEKCEVKSSTQYLQKKRANEEI